MLYPEKHTLGIADGNVHPRQSFDRLFGLSFGWLMTLHMRFNSVVAWVGITNNGGFLGQQSFSKRSVGLSSKVGQVLHAHTSRPSVVLNVISCFALRARYALNGKQNGLGSLASSAAKVCDNVVKLGFSRRCPFNC